MDEQRLSELFRDAAGNAPPASFGRDEVVAGSRRATARFRTRIAGGSLLGVALLAGGGLAVGQLGSSTGGDGATVAAENAPPPGDRAAEPENGTPLLAPGGDVPGPPGGGLPGSGQDTDTEATCGPADMQLADELTAILSARSAAPAGPAGAVPLTCGPGTRAAAVPVPGGQLYVLLAPRVTSPVGTEIDGPGGEGYRLPAASGGELTVFSVPPTPALPAPLAVEVPDIATELAAQF